MKISLLTLISIFLVNGTIFGQPGLNSQKRKEFKEMELKFIVNKLQLTDKEKKEFVPIYSKFCDERESLFVKKHQAMRNFKQNSLNMSDKELLKLSDELADIDIRLAQLNKQYNDKFKTVLPPIKIILLYQAEHEFKKELLKKVHRKGGGKMPPK